VGDPHYLPADPTAALAYAVLLVADTERPFRADSKQCRLETCAKFFFSSDTPAPTGRDRSRYCTPAHRNEAHHATSAERMRRWRERIARKSK
jgi:hypothetical protein